MTPQVLNPADVQPFVTTNALLAFCLYKAGVPFSDPSRPVWNTYDKDILFKIGGGEKDPHGVVTKPSRFAGMDPEDATRLAFANGTEEAIKGRVEYLFKITAQLSGLLKAYTDQEKQFKAAEKQGEAAWMEARQLTAEISAIPINLCLEVLRSFQSGAMSEAECLLRLAYLDLKMRPEFMNMWRQWSAIVQQDNPGKSRIEDVMVRNKEGHMVPGKQVVMPGAKLFSLNISDSKRKKLGLKRR